MSYVQLGETMYLEVPHTSDHGQHDGEVMFGVDERDMQDWAGVD